MNKTAKIIVTCIALVVLAAAVTTPLILYSLGYIDYADPSPSDKGGYLLVYFGGNEPENETIRFAVSKDGYNFMPINANEPVIEHNLGTGCARDPHITRGQDGKFYLVATDMRSELGWTSNHAIVTWSSTDLIHWENETIIDLKDYIPGTNRAWAPQAKWDPEKQMYMVYYSSSQWADEEAGTSTETCLWYAYTKDFTKFETQPEILFRTESGADCIDGDIISKDGKFYLYYKDQGIDNICYAVSDTLNGGYVAPENNVVNVRYQGVEGSFVYKLIGENNYLMIMDSYKNGCFYMQQSSDLVNFKRVKSTDYRFDFSPRHGAVLQLWDSEYQELVKAFGF